MFHLAANFVAIANVADTDVPALNDSILQVQNGHHIPARDMYLLAAWSSAVTLLRTKLVSPTIRQTAPSSIVPIDVTLLPPTDPNTVDYRSNPLLLRGQEEIVYQSTDSAAGPNNHYIITWLSDSTMPVPVGGAGPVYTLRGTGAATAVASVWTNCPVVWDTQLPQGRYAVVGCRGIGTTMVAFSMTFDNQYLRPGGLGIATAGLRPPAFQMKGGLGKWGEFNTVTLPRLSILCNAADTAQIFEMDVVRIG